MGVDACMFVRHKGEPLSDAEVKKISYLMTSTFGHRKFLQYEKGEIGDYPERRELLSRSSMNTTKILSLLERSS